jgi:hypothetical protein
LEIRRPQATLCGDTSPTKLDAAVFAAYGWPADLSDQEILARLLNLNLSRAPA